MSGEGRGHGIVSVFGDEQGVESPFLQCHGEFIGPQTFVGEKCAYAELHSRALSKTIVKQRFQCPVHLRPSDRSHRHGDSLSQRNRL